MTNAEVGIYIRLLCYAWLDKGLPTDHDELATMARESRPVFEKAWRRVGRCFVMVDGRLVQPRLERVRAEQDEYRARMADRSRRGVEARQRLRTERGQPQVQPTVKPVVEPNADLKLTPPPPPPNTSSLREAAGTAEKARYEKPPFPSHLPAALPDAVADLALVADDFLAAFGNVTTARAREKYGSDYVGALAAFRGRGCSAAEAWSAFGDARIANNGRPLFGAEAKKAISFAPSRSPSRGISAAPRGPYDRVPATIAAEDRR